MAISVCFGFGVNDCIVYFRFAAICLCTFKYVRVSVNLSDYPSMVAKKEGEINKLLLLLFKLRQ